MENDQSIGLVISTHGAAPYVNVHLALLERRGSNLRILVHNDGSDGFGGLRGQGSIMYTQSRLGGWLGDLAAVLHGLEWANELGLDVLVRMTRRFIPLFDWEAGLRKVLAENQAATYACPDASFGFPMRTECMALRVADWMPLCPNITRMVEENKANPFWRAISGGESPELRFYKLAQNAGEIARWDEMTGIGRLVRRHNLLWHDVDTPADYWRMAISLGLPYELSDFEDVSNSAGDEPHDRPEARLTSDTRSLLGRDMVEHCVTNEIADQIIELANNHPPDGWVGWKNVSAALTLKGDAAKALQAAARSVRLHRSPATLQGLACLLRRCGHEIEAKEIEKEALQLDPGYPFLSSDQPTVLSMPC